MFFGSKEKDLEIERLNAKIKALESELTSNDKVFDELSDILLKVQKGLFALHTDIHSSNPKVNQLIENLNGALSTNSELADRAIDSLMEYGNANFSFKVDTSGTHGKMGSIILGVRSLGCSISELMALLDETSDKLNGDMVELSNASATLAKASNDQAARLEETAAALEEVTETIASTSENTAKMAQLSNDVDKSASKGAKLANETYESMDSINSEVSAIEEAITVIDQIAFQTNILSLNAAVEAATAGEAGKGFAVVAQEVRNLATRSADAAKEIKDIVESAKTKADAGKNTATNMINGYKVLNENINDQVSIITDVSNAAREQQQAIEQINDAVNELDKTTQQNASAASQINSQSQSIQQLSQKLVDVVSHTTFDEKAKKQICDVDLMFTLNRLKLDHINFKNSNFKKLGTKTTWSVATENDCNLGKWINQQEKEGKPFTKTANWTELKKLHVDVHTGVQNVVDDNASNNLSRMLEQIATLDNSVLGVFGKIQEVKTENCHSSGVITNNIVSKPSKNIATSCCNHDSKPKLNKTNENTNNLKKVESSISEDDEWATF